LPQSNPYAINATAGSYSEYTQLLQIYFEPFTEAMYAASEQLCAENDVVIGHAACHTLLTASQKHNVPRISLVLVPLMLRSKHISPLGKNFGAFVNSKMWAIGDRISTQQWFKHGQAIRKREGMQRIRSLQNELFCSDMMTIVATSEAVVPRQPDWKANIHVTGFLNMPETGTAAAMPDDLQQFLKAGEAPVYMTFGSCMQFDLAHSTQLLVEAARISGRRVIIQSDWSTVERPTDATIFCIDRIPHGIIFPHCSLIVHHGGAGTAQAALLAGKPSVVVAHGFDQPYWGKQLQRIGVCGKTLIRSSVAARTLAHAISENVACETAEVIGARMRLEDGVRNAVKLIESLDQP
jgi:UDP:flavonoid glycosyltransferase YjiC (YdhE family)